jgi:predicted lipid-binding transport protein (Tim44 family)
MGLDGLGDGIASMVSGLLMFGILALVGFWLYKKFSPNDKDNTDVLPAVKSPTVT